MSQPTAKDPKYALNQREVRAYVNGGGVRCPYCQSDQIEGREVNFDLGTAYQEAGCNACGAEWEDAYDLNRIVLQDKPDEPRAIREARCRKPTEAAAT